MAFLTLDDLAERHGFSRQVWRRWVAEGKLRGHIEKRAWVVDEDEARAWVESRRDPEARRKPESVSLQARHELQRDPSRPNIVIARLIGAHPSIVSVERKKLGLPPLPHGGAGKEPPGWTGKRRSEQ